MIVKLWPGRMAGTLRAVPSKSEAHRLLIASALSDGETRLVCDQLSEDIKRTAEGLAAMGVRISHDGSAYSVSPGQWQGRPVIDCGESGASYRFLLPVACALGLDATFLLRGRLPQRPMAPLYDVLEGQGIEIRGKGTDRVSVKGRLLSGVWRVPGHISSQFVSGLMLAAPLTGGDCEIQLTSPLQSQGYVGMTMDALRVYGVDVIWQGDSVRIPGGQRYRSPGELMVSGDWSNAAMFLCAAAATGSQIGISGLKPDSLQGDRGIIDMLRDMGADIRLEGGVYQVFPAHLKGMTVDISHTPDLAPALAVAALGAAGKTLLRPTDRLRLKESDRAESIADTLIDLGADVNAEGDTLTIKGAALQGGSVDGQGDHRIVMMAAMAALMSAEPVTIKGAEAVKKSYPHFFDDLATLGVSSDARDRA